MLEQVDITNKDVAAEFDAYADDIRPELLSLRRLIRIDRVKSTPGQYALYVHCQTSLIEMFKERYPSELRYDGNRAILFDVSDALPEEALRHCIALALTYRLWKNSRDQT